MSKKILALILASSMMLTMVACSSSEEESSSEASVQSEVSEESEESEAEDEEITLVYESSMELLYAENFSVDYYEGGYKLITINGEKTFLTIPEGAEIPVDAPEDAEIIQLPITSTLVGSTPPMSLVDAIGALDNVSLTTYDVSSWYIETVATAITDGDITYIGSYSEPDYELIAAENPQLAVFSTMIDSYPEVGEKLDELEVTYFIDYSSDESHPLARSEWMKLYGAFYDMEDEAEATFAEQVEYLENIEIDETAETQTVAVFYITASSGSLYVRNGGDYMAEMVELAGGEYIFADLNPDESGSENMEFEAFYETAKDADKIIYIWSLGGKPETLEDFVAINALFEDFTAVQNGQVWCTTADFFQVSDTLGYIISDISIAIADDDATDLTYLNKLQ